MPNISLVYEATHDVCGWQFVATLFLCVGTEPQLSTRVQSLQLKKPYHIKLTYGTLGFCAYNTALLSGSLVSGLFSCPTSNVVVTETR